MSMETRAGIVTLLGIVALVGSIVFLRGGFWTREGGYALHMRVANAAGLTLGAPVQMAGIEIGRVRRLGLTPESKADILLVIRQGVAIPEGSRFSITSAGLLGDRLVAVFPGPPGAPALAPGSVVAGVEPLTTDELFERVLEVAKRAEEALSSVHRLIGDPALAEGLRETVRSARAASDRMARAAEHVERTTRTLDRTVAGEVPEIARRLRVVAEELAASAGDVRTMIRQVAADGRTAEQVRGAVSSIQKAAQGIEKMVGDLSGVVNEQEVRAVRASLAEARTAITDARLAVGEARSVIGRADRVVERVGRVLPERLELPDLRSTYRLEYAIWHDGTRLGHDVSFTLLPDASRSYLFTWREVGGANRIGLQVGSRLDERTLFRYGLIDSHLGVGMDYRASPSISYAADLYNISDISLNLYAHYHLRPDYGITLRVRSLFSQPTVGVGMFKRF